MRTQSVLFAATLLVLSGIASARNPSEDMFYRAARDAKFYCVIASGTLQVANEYGSRERDEYSDKVYSCIREREATMESALKAIPSDKSNAEIRQAAKVVFTQWLTFSKSLPRGITQNEADRGPEGLAFQSALDAYATELRLAD